MERFFGIHCQLLADSRRSRSMPVARFADTRGVAEADARNLDDAEPRARGSEGPRLRKSRVLARISLARVASNVRLGPLFGDTARTQGPAATRKRRA